LLLTHLDNAPGANDLEPAEVGIVGDPNHRGGYHCGSDRVVTNDYSVVESSRDRNGLSDFAAGLDVGDFSVTVNNKTHTLATFSTWCVQQCAAGAADTRDIREIIYSPDGSTVKRWDALGRRSTGDSSHRWHTHFSFFRDAIKAGRDQRPLFRRYLTTIGLLEDDDMTEAEVIRAVQRALVTPLALPPAIAQRLGALGWAPQMEPWTALARVVESVLSSQPGSAVDAPEVARIVLEGLTPEKIAAAIPATMAAQVADELARRMAN
jgi:hypothetical protein